MAVTLLVLDALMHELQRPLQLRDVERSVFSAIQYAISAGELRPAAFLRHDPPNLFAQLQELRQCAFVTRMPGGYEVTPEGHEQAHEWMRTLFSPTTVDRLREGARAAA